MAKLEKKHYWIIGGLALIAITGTVLYVRHQKKKKKELEDEKKNSLNYSGNSNFVEEPEIRELNEVDSSLNDKKDDNSFPLSLGSQNESVQDIQKYMNSTCPKDLKKAGVFPLIIDGVWGETTETACISCSSIGRKQVDLELFKRIKRDLLAANIK